MKAKILIVGILLVVVGLSGCIASGDDGVSGTYRSVVDAGILDLQNGEYEMDIDERFGGGGIFGHYTVREDVVRIRREFLGDFLKFAIDGRDLIDPDGDRWVRD